MDNSSVLLQCCPSNFANHNSVGSADNFSLFSPAIDEADQIVPDCSYNRFTNQTIAETFNLSSPLRSHHQSPNGMHQQPHYNNMLIQDKMWEDITASICDDFVTSIKTESPPQANCFRGGAQNDHSIHANGLQQPPQQIHSHASLPYGATTRHSQPNNGLHGSLYGNIANTSSYPSTNVATTNSCMIPSMHHPSNRLLYLPPTPPNSEPGSPSNQQQHLHQQHHPHHHQQPPPPQQQQSQQNQRRTPPPPYNCANNIANPMLHHPMHISSIHLSNGISSVSQSHQHPANHPRQCTTTSPPMPQPRYNRRNNPELEKRRIHRCDYPG